MHGHITKASIPSKIGYGLMFGEETDVIVENG